MVTEALVGAGLVLFEMVAENSSLARAYWMIAHLLNTFALLSFLSLTVWWAHFQPNGQQATKVRSRWLKISLAALVVVAASGAVAALGDTLFPSSSLAEGLTADFTSTAHPFVYLRSVHPVLAVAAALIVLRAVGRDTQNLPARVARVNRLALILVITQCLAGLVNILLLAPTWLQLVHLVLADVLWMSMIVLHAEQRSGPCANQIATQPLRPASPA